MLIVICFLVSLVFTCCLLRVHRGRIWAAERKPAADEAAAGEPDDHAAVAPGVGGQLRELGKFMEMV